MADETRIELGFDGGGVLRCSVAADELEGLTGAFAAADRGVAELRVDGERAFVDLARVVYVRELRAGRAISFAE